MPSNMLDKKPRILIVIADGVFQSILCDQPLDVDILVEDLDDHGDDPILYGHADIVVDAAEVAKAWANDASGRFEKGVPSHWEDDPEFPSSDWRSEVFNDNTRLGYVDWVASQREQQEGDKPKGIDHQALLDAALKAYIAGDSLKCPICHSMEIGADAPEADGLEAWVNVRCNHCNAQWQELFAMTECTFEFGELPDDWRERIKAASKVKDDAKRAVSQLEMRRHTEFQGDWEDSDDTA